jgi:serine/threonine protein kinase
MCNGQLPFETEQEILDYNLQIKANVSEEYKQLLYDCLKLDPTLRPNLEQVLEYSWCINNKEFNSSSLDNNSNIPSSNNLEVIDPQVVTTSTSTN